MDGGVARRIAALAAEGTPGRIFEVGAGTGALTAALLATGAAVTALEIDRDLIAVLREREDLGAATIVEGDALAFDFAAYAGEQPWRVAGNLPYNVATPLLTRLLELEHPPERIVAMIQRDVAERLTAAPATPQYGSLTVFMAYAARVRRAFVLGPNAFYPRPGVDSAVVVVEPHDRPPVTVRDRTFFLQVVRSSFAYRRKTLANALQLSLGIERERTQRALATLDIDSEVRAEQLDLGTFAVLADALTA